MSGIVSISANPFAAGNFFHESLEKVLCAAGGHASGHMEQKPLCGILAWMIGTMLGMVVFAVSGHGTYLTCSVEQSTQADFPDCYLRKRSLTAAKEEKFSRAGIKSVDWSVATHKTQRSKTSEDFWDIQLQSGGNIPLTLKGVAWPRGNLNLQSARALLLPQQATNGVRELRLVAYGLLPWFLGLLSGAIGWALALVALAKPVKNVSADELRRARLANLVLLVAATGISIGAWLLFFRLWENFLLSA